MIDITVNNEPYQFEKAVDLPVLLDQLKIPAKGIAIAINDVVVSRVNWNKTKVRDQDNILVIKAVQGG